MTPYRGFTDRRLARPVVAFLVLVAVVVVVVVAAVRRGPAGSGGPLVPAAAAAVEPPAPDLPGREVHLPGAGGSPDDGLVEAAGPNAIPPIDQPRFEAPARARGWLGGAAAVVVVRVGGDVRAYPLAILLWHEVVNDTVGGRPLAVTFCPLCNTAVVYPRTVGGRVARFHASGLLASGALVLEDGATGSQWAQPSGEQIAGPVAAIGSRLRLVASDLVTLDEAAHADPGLRVLSRATGFDRPYGTSPYPAVGRPGSTPGLFEGWLDERLPAKTRVLAAIVGGVARVWRYDDLRRVGVVEETVGGRPVLVVFRPEVTSIADSSDLRTAPAVGAAGLFDPAVDDRVLHLTPALRDRETGSTWDATGLAVAGPLRGRRLAPLPHLDTFWYAWAAIHPDTTRWVPPADPGRGPEA